MKTIVDEMREFDSTGLSPDSIHARLMSWANQLEAPAKDAERYQILTDDLRGALKDRRNSILFRMAVMGKGAADADIALLIQQAESDSEQP